MCVGTVSGGRREHASDRACRASRTTQRARSAHSYARRVIKHMRMRTRLAIQHTHAQQISLIRIHLKAAAHQKVGVFAFGLAVAFGFARTFNVMI